MSKQNVNVREVLDRLRSVFGATSDAALAEALGVTPGAVSNWRVRGSLDYALVADKAREVGADLHWLLTGERPGSVRRMVLTAGGRRHTFELLPGDTIAFE